MQRRTVFLASIGALHAVACGSEQGEEYGDAEQGVGSSTVSPSLPVKTIAIGGTTPGSLMRINVQVLPQLFIGTITLSKGASGVATSGTFKKGLSAKQPGSVDATISAQHYDYIVTQKTNGEKLAVELWYTIQGVILEVFVEII